MEDFHGHNKYGSPVKAWEAYVSAIKQTELARLPTNWEEDDLLARSMLEYYPEWLRSRSVLKTFWFEGKPQVEVKAQIPLPLTKEQMGGYDQVFYQVTLDRVVIDEFGRLWILDYKTAKQFVTDHLETDGQISAYCWAGKVLYPGHEIAGFVYQQHKKAFVGPPNWLQSGRYSVAKKQDTTWRLYRNALEYTYGSVEKAPADNQDYLTALAKEEDENSDMMIRRDFVYRNDFQIAAEGAAIMQVVPEMLNRSLPMYPNPTRDCSWDCQLRDICIAKDDGSDWYQMLQDTTMSRDDERDDWRKFV